MGRSDRPQDLLSAEQGISVPILFPGSVVDLKMEILSIQEPPGDTGILIFVRSHPFEWGVVGYETELSLAGRTVICVVPI